MQASRVVGYINNEGHLVVDVPLSLPPGQVEVIVLSTRTCHRGVPAARRKHVSTKTKSLQESAVKETSAQTSYTPEQEATIKEFLASAGCGSSGNRDSSVSVDEVLYGR